MASKPALGWLTDKFGRHELANDGNPREAQCWTDIIVCLYAPMYGFFWLQENLDGWLQNDIDPIIECFTKRCGACGGVILFLIVCCFAVSWVVISIVVFIATIALLPIWWVFGMPMYCARWRSPTLQAPTPPAPLTPPSHRQIFEPKPESLPLPLRYAEAVIVEIPPPTYQEKPKDTTV